MKVDMIIPVYRPDDTFCLLLQGLREQTFSTEKGICFQRLILLNTEEQLWEEAVAKYPIEELLGQLPCAWMLRHVKKEDFDHGGTRMLGAKLSDADVIVFMTQDAVPADAQLLGQLVGPFVGGEDTVAVTYARQLPNETCRIVESYTRQFNYPDTGVRKSQADLGRLGIKTFFCSDVCAAYRRELFFALGGFETPVIFNEDMFFAAKAIRAGYVVEYVADARVIHSHNYSALQQFHRNFDLAVSQADHPEIFAGISSESEGFRLVKSTMKYLCSIGKPWLIVQLGWQCVGKYAGYFLGKRYRRLSRKQILRCTMNPEYWRKVWKDAKDG